MSIRERTHTGGNKEFVYTEEDRRRIASEDTESTREFKDALREHKNKLKYRKVFNKALPHMKQQNKKTGYTILILLAVIIGSIYAYNNGYLESDELEKLKVNLLKIKDKIIPEVKEFKNNVVTDVKENIEETKLKIEQSNKLNCEEALILVNQLRRSNNIGGVIWSEDIYEIALTRAKDMVERDYFDHVTPEGTDVGMYLGNVGYSENIGKGYSDCKSAVEGWKASSGHRANLLFGTIGAIAKHSSVYVYVSTE